MDNSNHNFAAINSSEDNVSEKTINSFLKNTILVSLVSLFAGGSYYFILLALSSYFSRKNPVYNFGAAFSYSILTELASVVVSCLVVMLLSTIALQVLRVRRAFLVLFFSSLILYNLFNYTRVFIKGELQVFLFCMIAYLIALNLFNVIFNYFKIKLYILAPLFLMVWILSFYSLPIYANKYASNIEIKENEIYQKERDEKLKSIDFQLYAPKKTVGWYKLEHYDYIDSEDSTFSDPPYITLQFSLGLQANEYKTPSYYKPPKVCGQETPTSPDLSMRFSCEFVAKTGKGIEIYQYRQGDLSGIEHYFGRIGDTVISLDVLPEGFTKQEAESLYDSFERINIEGLKSINK